MDRRELFEAAAYGAGGQRIGEHGCKICVPCVGGPLGFQGDGIKFSGQHMRGSRHPRIGRDLVSFGGCQIVGFETREMIMRRLETMSR